MTMKLAPTRPSTTTITHSTLQKKNKVFRFLLMLPDSAGVHGQPEVEFHVRAVGTQSTGRNLHISTF
jgi:hypothetical protein